MYASILHKRERFLLAIRWLVVMEIRVWFQEFYLWRICHFFQMEDHWISY